MYVIESDRIGLRKLNLTDSNDLFEILSDEETMRYYPKPFTQDETDKWIKRSIQSYRDNRFGLWAIILKAEELFIGQCGISLQNIDGNMVPEIGFHINKKFWNRGYATETTKKCLEYGFVDLGLEEIFIHTYIKNIPSVRIAVKSGMKKIKEYDKDVDQAGSKMRHAVYSLKRD